jgi:hypothetical protein
MALKPWRHYLMGYWFELKTNHESLEHIFTQKDLNAQQRHWSELFSEYDFIISFIKGKENKVVDALSRRLKIHSVLSLKVDFKRLDFKPPYQRKLVPIDKIQLAR